MLLIIRTAFGEHTQVNLIDKLVFITSNLIVICIIPVHSFHGRSKEVRLKVVKEIDSQVQIIAMKSCHSK